MMPLSTKLPRAEDRILFWGQSFIRDRWNCRLSSRLAKLPDAEVFYLLCTNDRHRLDTPRHCFNENTLKRIPFHIEVDIPLHVNN